MGTKSEALRKLSGYVDRVNHYIKNDIRINEENTIVKFILSLFNILEWEQSSDDVEYQHTVREIGRTDITLRVEDIPLAIIEAKRFNEDLTEHHMRQAMKYRTPARWAIITNGREIRVYDKRYRQKWGRLFFKLSFNKFKEYFDILWLLSRYKIYKIDTVADKFMEWEKLIKEKSRHMKDGIIRDFIISALREEGARFRLILQAIKETRRTKVFKKKRYQRWSFEEIKKYMDFLKNHPKSFAYFKILSKTEGLMTKKELTERIRREIKNDKLRSKALAGIRAGICAHTDRDGKERLDYETLDHRHLSINKKYKNLLRKYFSSY